MKFLRVNAPNVEHMITGVADAYILESMIVLIYEDGTSEARIGNHGIPIKEAPMPEGKSLMSLTSWVQDARPKNIVATFHAPCNCDFNECPFFDVTATWNCNREKCVADDVHFKL